MTDGRRAPLYVQYGCGFSVGPDWLNFDSSPTLRVERIPVIGRTLGRLAGNRQSFPREVLYGDICRGLPVPDGSARAIYASHVLEHLSLADFHVALANTLRMLEPGGLFRLVVPDLQERARRYLEGLARGETDANSGFLRTCHLGLERRPRSPLARARQVMGGSAHLWMWDEPSMIAALERAGFAQIRRCSFGDSGDAKFAQVESAERFTDTASGLRELAVEARKPVPPAP